MNKRYFRKKNPLCRTEEIEWIEMTGKEFLAFVNAPCNAGRFFIDMDDVVLECTEAEHQAYRSEVNHHNYLMEQEEGWETVSLYCLEPDTGCNGEEVIADSNFIMVEDLAITNIQITALKEAISLLSDEERTLIEMKYLSDTPLSQEEIAKNLGISQSTASRHLTAAKKILKNLCIKVEKSQQQKVRGKT